MIIYLDLCCLKRPFDDQSQARVRLESEAVLALLAMESAAIQFVRSTALTLENAHNPVKERAARVQLWIDSGPVIVPDVALLQPRIAELMALGFKNLDAMHVATAEHAAADVLATCDDRFLAVATRTQNKLRVRVAQVLELAKEVAS